MKKRKKIFITGSTRGIGRAIAIEFSNNNYDVILNGTKENAESIKLIKKIKKKSPNSGIYYFDVSNYREIEDGCKKIISRYKVIDILINNAGLIRDNTLVKMANDEWDKVIKTNLYGPYYVTKEILPIMINNNFGRIINISSIVALSGNFGQTNYAASKAGLLGFTKSLAKEVAKYNITVNAICPGFTATDMVKSIPKEILESKIIPKILLKRMAKPEEIANLVLFLASEKSGYITGKFLEIDGGLQ